MTLDPTARTAWGRATRQSRSRSLIAVLARVCASTRFTITAQARFGPGVVETITAASDPQITIVFDSGEQRTFLASLVVDKLQAL